MKEVQTMTGDRHDQTSHGFAVGLLCGVAAGAAIALLFAPTDGRQLRSKLGDSARRLGHQSKDVYETTRRSIGDAMAAGRDAFQKVRTEGGRVDA
jgi:gas vesicle protein